MCCFVAGLILVHAGFLVGLIEKMSEKMTKIMRSLREAGDEKNAH
jgi:hypothetical protein